MTRKYLIRDAWALALLVIGGSACGLLYNRRLLQETFFSGPGPAAAPAAMEEGIKDISLAEAKSHFDRKSALFVDARRDLFYRQERISSAVCLPFSQYEKYEGAFEKQVAKDTAMILYCSGYGCEDSHQLAKRLQEKGYRRMAVFYGGFPEWKQAGYPTESSPAAPPPP